MSATGKALYSRARKLIPGGTQLLSKRPEQFLPEHWPCYYDKAKGVEVWDLDGNKYIDMSLNGVGSCILGFADPDVNAAVKDVIDLGSMTTLNCPEEVELADLLCELHPWADSVRYARSGGEAKAMAVRIARAKTRKDKVAFCGYHGWHDWYLAANLSEENALDGHLLSGLNPAGVPRCLTGTSFPFRYNNISEIEEIAATHGNELAAIVMEPIRGQDPDPGFLQQVRDIATSVGAVLIFDEITSALRLNTGGAHLLFDVNPDIAVFAKAISNGYPMSVVIGVDSVMQAAQESFISSTNWTERIGPTAAITTIRKHQRLDVSSHLIKIGEQVMSGWKLAAQRVGLDIIVGGIPPLGHFQIVCDDSEVTRTLFTQIMLDKGFLATKSFYATYAHQPKHVENYLVALQETFKIIAEALNKNNLEELLKGPVAHTGFQRLT